MQLVLEQNFPLGRFHATPWKAFPYDDPHGEWPPSPWRLVRAVLARSFQMDREIPESLTNHVTQRKALVQAFAASEVSWSLPASTWRGPGLRQYVPAEFKRVPASAKEPGMMAYNTTKVLDNFWVTSTGDSSPLLWLFDGFECTNELLSHLDACLARMTYFGRAESITDIRRLTAPSLNDSQLVSLHPRRTGNAIPVLTLKPDATLAQLEATTDSASVRDRDIPPGSKWMFAERPARPPINTAQRSRPQLSPVSFIQFAIGFKVAARYKDTVFITERFRRRAISCLTKILTGASDTAFCDMNDEVRKQIFKFSGKGEDGKPAVGHHHVSFFLFGTKDLPSRLCVWRKEPFSNAERRALTDAASFPLPFNYKDKSWPLTLVLLDNLVPPPPGFDGKAHCQWISLTPYVPPNHVFGRTGKPKPGYSVIEQLKAELAEQGVDISEVAPTHKDAGWVKTHGLNSAEHGRTNRDKRGYQIELTSSKPLEGPLFLGSSCHFGLGFFIPNIYDSA